MRRSSVALLILGVLLIAASAAIKYVAVPHLSKLPENTSAGATFVGTLRQIDPVTLALDAGTPVAIDRSIKVDQVVGDTAVVTSTAITHPPSGDTTDSHTYGISRVDYSQVAAPDGVQVEDQRGGVTLSFPMNPTTDDAFVYDSVTRTAQPVTYTGTSILGGREVHEFTGTTTAPIADPAILGQIKAGGAALAHSGDGSTLPKEMLQTLLPALPADRLAAARQALDAAPNQVPLIVTSVNTMTLSVDTRFGAPINISQNQTAVLNAQTSAGVTVPLLDLSQVQVEASGDSIASAADGLVRGERQLNLLAIWIPLGTSLLGLVLIAIAVIRRPPRVGMVSTTGDSSADITTPQSTRTPS